MTKLKYVEAWVTVGDSRTLTGGKHGNWHGYQRRYEKLYHVTLSSTVSIPGLYTNIFSMVWALQNVFQVTSEGETQILNRNSTDFFLTKRWWTNPVKDFYWPPSSTRDKTVPLFWPLSIRSYKGKHIYRGKGWLSRNRIIQQPKQIATGNIHANKLYTKLGHPGEDRMRATTKHLHYIVKWTIEICEYCGIEKSRQKLVHKVV